MPCTRFRRAVVLKDQALGVFVSGVSSPFGWVRQRIADRLVQASGSALVSSEARGRSAVDDENTLHIALDAPGIASEAGPVDQWVLARAASDAALDDLAASEEARRHTDHGSASISTGMWQRA